MGESHVAELVEDTGTDLGVYGDTVHGGGAELGEEVGDGEQLSAVGFGDRGEGLGRVAGGKGGEGGGHGESQGGFPFGLGGGREFYTVEEVDALLGGLGETGEPEGEEAFAELLGELREGIHYVGDTDQHPESGVVVGEPGLTGCLGALAVVGVAEVPKEFLDGLTVVTEEVREVLDNQYLAVQLEDQGRVLAVVVPVAGDQGVIRH